MALKYDPMLNMLVEEKVVTKDAKAKDLSQKELVKMSLEELQKAFEQRKGYFPKRMEQNEIIRALMNDADKIDELAELTGNNRAGIEAIIKEINGLSELNKESGISHYFNNAKAKKLVRAIIKSKDAKSSNGFSLKIISIKPIDNLSDNGFSGIATIEKENKILKRQGFSGNTEAEVKKKINDWFKEFISTKDAKMKDEVSVERVVEIILDYYTNARYGGKHSPDLINAMLNKPYNYLSGADKNAGIKGVKAFIKENERYKKEAEKGQGPSGGQYDPRYFEDKIQKAKQVLSRLENAKVYERPKKLK